ncbi:ACP S-malonyltransferase [Reinekea blandensis]|uniref:Malonyl CoA-acyl carrier protein transacylase n=1 Tax=Reinekea blandensis MED297 TaxID=314283 RepID=A4BDZ5_9GAMM|nr:ACP S-malonyltransferase [Reinekea blandensis]EAR09754.1 acyl-carrier-protein S-malonyltransferase [Reinekea blandensis MED297]
MSKIAFVFPGQGSQQVGMLTEFSEQYDIVKQTVAEANDALGYDLGDLIANGPVEELNRTQITQPALLTASVALYRLWQAEGGVEPMLFAGHSLGEYSALVAAGVVAFSDAVKLVETRGQLMQNAVPAGEGLMAAVLGLDDQSVIDGCAAAAQGDVVSAVNFNTDGQVVIAGAKAAVERAMDELKTRGAKRVMPLTVSVPSHCALMKPAAEQLAESLQATSFATPSAPVVQNRSAEPATTAEQIKSNLLEQLYMPVLWTRTVSYLVDSGVEEIIECGPGKVLTGLNKRMAKSLTHTVIGQVSAFQERIG